MHSESWQHALLSLADVSWDHAAIAHSLVDVSPKQLMHARVYCDHLTSQHSRSFYIASALLPTEKRRATHALYAFCRTTDDIVDRPTCSSPRHLLELWRKRALRTPAEASDWVVLAWQAAQRRYFIPTKYAEQLIDGVAKDLEPIAYQTFDELANYAYGVAATVGLMSMHIVGFADKRAIPYAVKLGVALQLTNILRDIGEDFQNGRVYLPAQEMAAFGLGVADLRAGVVTPAWRTFMQFQIARARQLYAESWAGIGLLNRDGRLAIAVAANLYQAILTEIERLDYAVFSQRAVVSTGRKLWLLARTWQAVQQFPT
jgi:phytoene synthase